MAARPVVGDAADSWNRLGLAHLESNVDAAGIDLSPQELNAITGKKPRPDLPAERRPIGYESNGSRSTVDPAVAS